MFPGTVTQVSEIELTAASVDIRISAMKRLIDWLFPYRYLETFAAARAKLRTTQEGV